MANEPELRRELKALELRNRELQATLTHTNKVLAVERQAREAAEAVRADAFRLLARWGSRRDR